MSARPPLPRTAATAALRTAAAPAMPGHAPARPLPPTWSTAEPAATAVAAPAAGPAAQPVPPAADTPPPQRWSLLRNHALTPQAFIACMGALAVLLLITGTAATLLGFWPIGIFCALQVAALAAACVHFSVHALDGEELLLHDDGQLEVRCAQGLHQQQHRLPLAWARLERRPSPTAKGYDLWIVCGRRALCVGRHARAPQVERVQAELRRAQQQAAAAARHSAR